jgi:uncharacterized protein (TIGR02266 family)
MKNVMVVDKSSAFLKLMEIIIARLGYGTSAVKSAGECLRILRAEGSDLILTELSLADGSGPELCRQVRNDPDLAEIPIVILTTENSEEKRRQAFDSGCDEYLTKPLTVRPLFATLEKLAGQRRRKQIRTNMESFAEVSCGGESLNMETFNIGEGGVFLKPLPVGDVIDLSLTLPGRPEPMKLRGEVLYAFGAKVQNHPPGMGVKFVDVDADRQAVLTRYVESYVARGINGSDPGFAADLPMGVPLREDCARTLN